MTAEEIKHAIECMKSKLPPKVDYAELVCAEDFACGYHFVYEDEEGYIIEDVINVLQKELERTENKPLTIEQLKEMVGEPVYIHERGEWIIVDSVGEIDELESVMQSTGGETFTFDFSEEAYSVCMFSFYKHNPQEK